MCIYFAYLEFRIIWLCFLGGCTGRGEEGGRDNRIVLNNYTVPDNNFTLPNTSTIPVLNDSVLDSLGVATGGGNMDINSGFLISANSSSDDEDDAFAASGYGSGYPVSSLDSKDLDVDGNVFFENV